MSNHRAQIQKLLRLSKSPNPNEAAVALKKAHELMEKYGCTDVLEYSEKWQQDIVSLIEKYPMGDNYYVLIDRIMEVVGESGHAEDPTYQEAFIDGIKACLKRRFPDLYKDWENKYVIEVEIPCSDEEYNAYRDIQLNGNVIGDLITADFLDGVDIKKEDYYLPEDM